jgi:hypothetical protein
MQAESIKISSSATVTVTVQTQVKEQYRLRVTDALNPVTLTVVLPWSVPPVQINVWRGAHVWHVTNTTLNSGELAPVLTSSLFFLFVCACVRAFAHAHVRVCVHLRVCVVWGGAGHC